MTAEDTEPSQQPQHPVMGASEFYRTLGRLEVRHVHVRKELDRLERNAGYGTRLADLEVVQAESEEQLGRLIEYANRWCRNDYEVNYTLGRIEFGQQSAAHRITRLKRKTGG